MSKNFRFSVGSRKEESYLPDIRQKITITASGESLKNICFYFSFSFDEDAGVLNLREVSLSSYAHTSWQNREKESYLEGKFDFRSGEEISNALIELKKAFLDKEYSIEMFDASWRKFHVAFVEWYRDEFTRYLNAENESCKLLLDL